MAEARTRNSRHRSKGRLAYLLRAARGESRAGRAARWSDVGAHLGGAVCRSRGGGWGWCDSGLRRRTTRTFRQFQAGHAMTISTLDARPSARRFRHAAGGPALAGCCCPSRAAGGREQRLQRDCIGVATAPPRAATAQLRARERREYREHGRPPHSPDARADPRVMTAGTYVPSYVPGGRSEGLRCRCLVALPSQAI